MAATGQGATFTFTSDRGTFSGGVTNVSVESPAAEVVDMTGISDAAGNCVLVPTGSWKGGAISVEFIAGSSSSAESLVRGIGTLSFASPGFSVTKRVVLESASTTVGVNEVVRGSMKFLMTDYAG